MYANLYSALRALSIDDRMSCYLQILFRAVVKRGVEWRKAMHKKQDESRMRSMRHSMLIAIRRESESGTHPVLKL